MLDLLKQLPVGVALSLAATVTVAGDYFGKLWSIEQKPWIFCLAILLYASSGILYIPTLLKEGLIITSLIWTILTITGFLAVGVLIFHEQLTPVQWAGVAFGVLAIVLLSV